MKTKYIPTAFFLLLSVLSYSQTVLIDNNGDTSVQITLQQMDRIYTELIDKDNLIAQSILNTSKEIKLYELVDSAKKDIRLLKTSVNSLSEDNTRLYEIAKDKDEKIIRNRKISVVSVCVAILAILLR
tara:strand:- start:202 stop:585 length:384 start_codon:yes stop_codon:yes gene_type:complete